MNVQRFVTFGKFVMISVVFLTLCWGFAGISHAQPQLTSITISPSSPPPYPMTVGQSETFTATGYDQYGDPYPLSDPQWSGDGQYGTINPDLQNPTMCTYTATSVGSGWIQCYEGGTQIHGSTDIDIQPGGELARIEVTPGDVTLQAGDQQQFTAKGFDADNNEVPIDPIWSTNDGTITSGGLYTATTTGDFSVTVSVEGSDVSGTAGVHVTPGALLRIEVTPGDVTLQAGDQQQFTAKGYDDHNNEVPIDPIWSTDGGDITSGGLYTAPLTEGDYTVSASAKGSQVTGTASVHVGPCLLPGDANADGAVDVLDVLTIVNSVLGLDPAPFHSVCADCNADRQINVLDALGVVNVVLGSGECVP